MASAASLIVLLLAGLDKLLDYYVIEDEMGRTVYSS